jgi:hypothetical protein
VFSATFKKPVTINNWKYAKSGHVYNESVFRMPDTGTGAALSAHKRGMAIDIKVSGIEAKEVQQDVIDNFPDYKAVGVTTIELWTPTWTHLSCEWTLNPDEIFKIHI